MFLSHRTLRWTEWFDFWIENIVGDLAPNTLRNYRERYKHNIQPIIGIKLLSDVKPMHCKKCCFLMDADYSGIHHPADLYHNGYDVQSCEDERPDFQAPMDGVRFTKPVRAPDDIQA